MNKKILVIGATGLIGSAVARQLNADGYDVIVLTRKREKARKLFPAEVEIIEADLNEPRSFTNAFHGVHGIFVSLPERESPALLKNVLDSVNREQVRQIVYISGCTVRKENAWHPMIGGHYRAECLLRDSGIPFTLLRLTMVMDMIPRYANGGKPFIIGRQAHGWSWIHSGDIARAASKAFCTEEAKNRAFTLFGPDKMTITEAVDACNAHCFPQAAPAKPKPYWLASILSLFVGEKLRYAISIFRYFEDHPEEGDPSASNTILGKPETGIADYLRRMKNDLA